MTWALGRPDIDCDLCAERSAGFGNDPPCETCPLPGISTEDVEVWELYQAINSQFVYDFHALPLVFEIHDIHCTRSEAKELLKKLSIIHDLITKNRATD